MNQAGQQPLGLGARFLRHIRHEWRATVFVTACVFLAHNVFDVIDTYAYVAIDNLTKSLHIRQSEPAPENTRAVVVRIDQKSYESRHQDRSPLNRCELASLLESVYDARPKAVVIDLDLSRAVWLREAGPESYPERACEQTIYMLIKERAGGDDGIRTVLIDPFEAGSARLNANKLAWQYSMLSERIQFASPDVPVRYGVTNEFFADPGSLYVVLKSMLGDADRCSPEHGPCLLDAAVVKKNIRHILTSDISQNGLTHDLRSVLPAGNAVVFFGGGYGEDDQFLTPLGKFYGVDVHAAAFASDTRHLPHVFGLLFELVMAFVFGFLINGCWRRYFDGRTSTAPGDGPLAGLWVLAMIAVLVIAIGVAMFCSWLLLGSWGIWTSPIPIAVGMLIEGCTLGSVEQSNHKLQQFRAPSAAVLVGTRQIAVQAWQSVLWAFWLYALGATALELIPIH